MFKLECRCECIISYLIKSFKKRNKIINKQSNKMHSIDHMKVTKEMKVGNTYDLVESTGSLPPIVDIDENIDQKYIIALISLKDGPSNYYIKGIGTAEYHKDIAKEFLSVIKQVKGLEYGRLYIFILMNLSIICSLNRYHWWWKAYS